MQVQQPFSAPTSPGSPAARPHCLSPAPVPSTSDPNWQATRAGLRERNAAMFNNELMADVHFVAGPPGEEAETQGGLDGKKWRSSVWQHVLAVMYVKIISCLHYLDPMCCIKIKHIFAE